MKSRPLKDSDVPILEQMANDSGYPYPDLRGPHIEAVEVVTDDDGNVIMGCAAKRLVEVYLYTSDQPPAVKLRAIRMIHHGMAHQLRDIGYNSGEAFLPSEIAGKFGRRLERTFKWVRNWQSWTVKF